MTIRPLLSGDELGWRLAGLADGEGCFAIAADTRKRRNTCRFIVGMRADDRAFLELMQASTGFGILYDVKPSALALSRRPGTNPQIHWQIARKAEVIAVADLFDRYPPLSKKARDFAIWREAVEAWKRHDQQRMDQLRIALTASRAYAETDADLAVLDDPQASLFEVVACP